MTALRVAEKAQPASSTQTAQVIHSALREAYRLTEEIAGRRPSTVLFMSLYSACEGMASRLRRLQPLAHDEETRAVLAVAIKAVESAQVAVVRKGAPRSETAVTQDQLRRKFDAFTANVARAPLPVRGGLRRDV